MYAGATQFPLDETTAWSPLVVSNTAGESGDVEFLERFVASHSDQLHADIAKFGAVILRGFALKTVGEFERIISNIKGFWPVTETFMCQPGRALTQGSDYVFETDVTTITGGAFSFGFHSEHYFSPDVPTYHCWVCLKAPKIAGETGLVLTSNVYDDLPDELKTKLRQTPFICAAWPIARVAQRYQVPESVVEAYCKEVGLDVGASNGKKSILLLKPTICRHPVTGRLCFQANLSIALPKLGKALKKVFSTTTYSGARWAFHRLVWKRNLVTLAEALSLFLHFAMQGRFILAVRHAVHVILQSAKNAVRKVLRPSQPKPKDYTQDQDRVVEGIVDESSAKFCPALADFWCSEEDIRCLAHSIQKNLVLLKWQSGDILLLDNRQTLHSGMPGFLFPREIKVMMCNPIRWEPAVSGCRNIPDGSQCQETLVSRLKQFSSAAESAPPASVEDLPQHAAAKIA